MYYPRCADVWGRISVKTNQASLFTGFRLNKNRKETP